MAETKLDRIQFQHNLPLHNVHFVDKVEHAFENLKKYSDVRDVLIWSDGEIHWDIRILHNLILQNQQTEWLKNTKFYIAGCHIKKRDSIKYDYGNEVIFLDLYPTPFTIFNKHFHFEPLLRTWEDMVEKAEVNLINEKVHLERQEDKVELVTWLAYGKRLVRDYLYLQLCKRNMVRNVGYHSMLKEAYPELKYASEKDFESIGKKEDFKEYQKIIFSLPKRLNTSNMELVRHEYYQESLQDYYRGLFALITETQFEFNLPHLFIDEEPFEVISITEKIMFPFFSKSIPIILHDENNEILEYLKKLGFDMFEDIVNESVYQGSAIDKIDAAIYTLEQFQNDNPQKLFLRFKERLQNNQKLAIELSENIEPVVEILKNIKAQNIVEEEIIPKKMNLI